LKTLSTLTVEEWEDIRDTFSVSKVLVWRAPTPQEFKRHQGKPVGLRRLGDGGFEVQINYDAIRCRPRSVQRDQFTLYCLYVAMAKIELGHLDEGNQREWGLTRIRNGRRLGLKTLLADLEREASDWAVSRLEEDHLGTRPELRLAAS
jgi:hypothetical protein